MIEAAGQRGPTVMSCWVGWGGRSAGEPRLQAGTYVDGLLSDAPRKNGWSLAERAGDRTPDKMQRLLGHAVWDEHEAMGIVRDFVVEHLGGPGRSRGPRGPVTFRDLHLRQFVVTPQPSTATG